MWIKTNKGTLVNTDTVRKFRIRQDIAVDETGKPVVKAYEILAIYHLISPLFSGGSDYMVWARRSRG